MAEWYVKDLSKQTGVSVQTLHHYDRIGLLQPSVRLPNGYRIYSEKDLLKLQQIVALKFFGFTLAQMKTVLGGEVDAKEHFTMQATLLEQKAEWLLDASKALNGIVADVADSQSIPWKKIIEIIEVYNMTQKLEHNWVKEIFTAEEMKQYLTFEAELKTHSTPEQKAAFEKGWADLIALLNRNLQQDPRSSVGIAIGEQCMKWVNGVYGKKYAHLRTKKFEQGFAEGKGLEEVGLTKESVAWLDKAMDAYWRDRIYRILDQVGQVPSSVSLEQWHDVLDDMYGDDHDRKDAIRDLALEDDKISDIAKAWLKKL